MKFYGWVEEVRNIGNLKFIKLHTVDEDLQVIIKKKEVSKGLFDLVDNITRQSAIVIDGEMKTNKEAPGGKEIVPKNIEVLGMSEAVLPLDPSGKTPAEMETRLDWRFLDFRSRKPAEYKNYKAKITFPNAPHRTSIANRPLPLMGPLFKATKWFLKSLLCALVSSSMELNGK